MIVEQKQEEIFLFIVGMPRSGTKLLRDLLNRHSRISIPDVETLFYPHFIEKFGMDFPKGNNKREVLQAFFATPFWDFNRNREIDLRSFENDFFECHSWQEFYELISFYFGPNKKSGTANILFGDKSPNYVYHIEILGRIIKNAKFVHIIRDPRDYCLSMKKTWNKNMFRAAHRWREAMQSTRKFRDGDNYLEVKYEDLTSDTQVVIEKICRFIHVDYEPDMVTLLKPSENYGDAKGMARVVSTNSEKFKSVMTEDEICMIERLTLPEIIEKDYQVFFAKSSKGAKKLDLMYWRILDIYHLAKFNVGEFGLIKGLGHFKKYVQLH